MSIYTKFGRQKTIRQFIKKFFDNGVGTSSRTNVTTFHDKECNLIQCYPGKYRSFEDIFECIQTYYPSITIQKLMHILLTTTFKYKDNILYLHMGSCSTIG